MDAEAGTIDVTLELGIGAGELEVGVMFYPGLSKDSFVVNPEDDIFLMGINIGLYYNFIGLRWFLGIGPGLTVFYPYNSNQDTSSNNLKTYLVPYLQARFDFRFLEVTYLRVGYRLDLYPEDLAPVFGDHSFKNLGNFFYTHNILFGIVFKFI